MGNRFSIEELTCLHLLRCHHADICSKEERELRETIALHPTTLSKAKMILERQKEAGICVIPYYADDYPVSFAKIGAEAPALIHLLGDKELLYIVHPKANISLQREIINKGGLIISEQPFGVKANPTRLYARNRLQAALAQKVIVVQCAVKSGTMNTVYFAHKYGCKIYAVAYGQYDKHNAGNEYILNKGIGFPIKL